MNSASATPHPVDRSTPPPGVAAVRLGELDAGVVALAGRGGVASVRPGTRTSWWIGAEDRWHRPEDESSTRDRLIDGAPVLETLVRIPSGDAVGRTTVARVDGLDRPSVVLDIENASPIPVAFAYVVESDAALSVDSHGVLVAGVGRLTLTRPAMGYAVAPTLDELAAILESGDIASTAPTATGPGAVAILVPLPHTAHAVATFTPDVDGPASDADLDALTDRERIPAPDRIVAGWAVHSGGGPRLDLVDVRHRTALAAAICDLLLGPDTANAASHDVIDPLQLGTIVEALGRLGRTDDPVALNDLLDEQRPNGSVPGADDVESTVQLLAALASWWEGGAQRDYAELYLGAIANAAKWLSKRKQRAALAGRGPAAATALRRAAAVLHDLDQPDVADALIAQAGRLDADASGPTTPTAAAMLASLGDGLAWGGAGGAPDAGASARFVVTTLDEAVRSEGDALALAAGWQVTDAGTPIEAHDLPTRWGRLSYGIRWHGPRPALLWELAPWPARAVLSPLRVTAPAIDPAWSSDDAVGEALLEAPAGASPAPEPIVGHVVHPQLDPPSRPIEPSPSPAPPQVPDSGSFS